MEKCPVYGGRPDTKKFGSENSMVFQKLQTDHGAFTAQAPWSPFQPPHPRAGFVIHTTCFIFLYCDIVLKESNIVCFIVALEVVYEC